MGNMHKRHIALVAIVLVGIALYFGNRWLQDSCLYGVSWADAPPTTRAEVALLLREASALFQAQRYDVGPDQPLQKPMKADVSGRLATLWIAGPMYAGDLRYAQLWQQVYRRYHRGARCVHLRLTWDNGTILQEFPPVTL